MNDLGWPCLQLFCELVQDKCIPMHLRQQRLICIEPRPFHLWVRPRILNVSAPQVRLVKPHPKVVALGQPMEPDQPVAPQPERVPQEVGVVAPADALRKCETNDDEMRSTEHHVHEWPEGARLRERVLHTRVLSSKRPLKMEASSISPSECKKKIL